MTVFQMNSNYLMSKRKCALFRLVLFFLSIFTLNTHAQIPLSGQTKDKLSSINTKITKLNESKIRSQSKKQDLISKLKNIDLNISKNTLKLANTTSAIERQENKIRQLKIELRPLQREVDIIKKQLVNYLLLSKQLGNARPIVLLLNQKDPTLTSRLMTYIAHINKNQTELLKTLSKLHWEVKEKQTQEKVQLAKLQLLISNNEKNLLSYQESRKAQKILIMKINQKMSNQTKQIAQLTQDKQKLQLILNNIARLQQVKTDKIPFYKLKSKLPWPIAYKSKGSNQKSIVGNGLYLKSKEGRQISTVRSGKVVFADWLRGYGLLIIIQHDQGYMSLYANNQALYKEKGQKVYTGEKIATVGHSGGQLNDGLYFEIRKDGKPLPPLDWLRPSF